MSGPGIEGSITHAGRLGFPGGSGEDPEKRLLRHLDQLRKAVRTIHARGIEYSYRCANASAALEQALALEDEDKIQSCYREMKILCTEVFVKELSSFLPPIKECMARDALYQPRVCIKNPHIEKRNEIVELICRDTPYTYISSYLIEENTGFHHVNRTGNRYLENDIPTKIVQRKYKNPRINEEFLHDFTKAHQQYHGRFQSNLRRFKFGSRFEDRYNNEWKKIWQSFDESGKSVGVEDIDCYKSTLIIPVTMTQTETSSKFDDQFFSAQPKNTVFAYLCFDSLHTHYFVEQVHVPIGYMIADEISTFFLVKYGYTVLSKAWSKARTRCEQV